MKDYKQVNEAVVKHYAEKTGKTIVDLGVNDDSARHFGSATTLVRDQLLTNYAIKYMPDKFVADLAAPRIPVAEISGKILNGSVNAMKRHPTQAGRGKSQPNEIFPERQDDKTYSVKPYALMTPVLQGEVDDAQRAGLPFIKPFEDAVQLLRQVMGLDREYRVLGGLVNASVFTNTLALSGGSGIAYYWDNASDGDPISVVRQAKRVVAAKSGQTATHIIWPQNIRDAAHTHAKTKAWKNESKDYTPDLTSERIGTFMGLTSISADAMCIAEQEFANAGHTADFSYVVGNNAVVLSIPSSPSLYQPYAMATFALGTPQVKKVRNDLIGGGTGGWWVVLVEAQMDERVIDAGCAYLITSVLEVPGAP